MQPFLSVEHLEDRQMLAATPVRILSAYMDNRGQAAFNVSVALNTNTLTRKTCTIFTAGADAKFGTADDVMQYTAVGYKRGLLTLRANIAANQAYRVKLNSAYIRDINGFSLDGEFKGNGVVSGNGRAGGNYDITTVAGAPRARMTTAMGAINVALYTNSDVSNTVNNFKTYANSGAWDNSFFHRSVVQNIYVVQGGGYGVNSQNAVTQIPANAGIATQAGHSNAKGTIAMANTGQANSNTNQWYFNVRANTNLDGNYSVFGAVMDTASQRLIEAMNALPIVDASGGQQSSPFGELPVLRKNAQVAVPADLLMVYRVAMMVDAQATTISPAVGTPQAAAPAVVAPATNLFSAAPIKNPALEQ